ncbi:MAG: acyltransferase [Cytophagaceae bacterium]
MASFQYLFKNRKRYSVFTTPFLKAWLKRILLFKRLIVVNWRWCKLKWAGADIHGTTEVGLPKIEGNKHNLKVGSFTTLGRIEIALHDKVIIGNNVCINDGVILLTASHDILDPEWKHKKGAIIIEDYVWIATNAIILPNVKIGVGAVIGAGAVVSKSVPSYSVVVGNPMKIIEKKRVENLNYNPCEYLALNNAWVK